MKKTLVAAAVFFSLMLVSCGGDFEWSNPLDPAENNTTSPSACQEKTCGFVTDESGNTVLCGVCTDDSYCSSEQKCEKRCGNNACGKKEVQTVNGTETIQCGSCSSGFVCTAEHVCRSASDICGNQECGTVDYFDEHNSAASISCGSCNTDSVCDRRGTCVKKTDLCIDRCGDVTENVFGGVTTLHCGECHGQFAYCSTANTCVTACRDMECGTDSVTTVSGSRSFDCGTCEGALAYCNPSRQCRTACTEKECGSYSVETIDGTQTMQCGTCSDDSFCTAHWECAEGTRKGDYVFDNTIVLDTTTSLMWVRSNGSEKTAAEATLYCSQLSEGGFVDWRLPTISELRTVVEQCEAVSLTGTDHCGVEDTCAESTCLNSYCAGCTNGAGPGPSGLYLAADVWTYSGDSAGRFWSSTKTNDKPDSLWFLRFSNASVNFDWKGKKMLVLCVRRYSE